MKCAVTGEKLLNWETLTPSKADTLQTDTSRQMRGLGITSCDFRRSFFTDSGVEHWDRLPREWSQHKKCLDNISRDTGSGIVGVCAQGQQLHSMTLVGSFSLWIFHVSIIPRFSVLAAASLKLNQEDFLLLYGVLHQEIVVSECFYICLSKIQDTALAIEQGLPWYWLAWGRTYVHNPRAQDQLPPGTTAECLTWDLPSPTNLLYWQELSCQTNRQKTHKSRLAERTPWLRKAVWPLFLPWRIPWRMFVWAKHPLRRAACM